MHEGFDITFREVIPEASIIELVIDELAHLDAAIDRHCSVVLRRSEDDEAFAAWVALDPELRGDVVHGEATGPDLHAALHRAFADLRDHALLH